MLFGLFSAMEWTTEIIAIQHDHLGTQYRAPAPSLAYLIPTCGVPRFAARFLGIEWHTVSHIKNSIVWFAVSGKSMQRIAVLDCSPALSGTEIYTDFLADGTEIFEFLL